jgi:hypothetical protein
VTPDLTPLGSHARQSPDHLRLPKSDQSQFPGPADRFARRVASAFAPGPEGDRYLGFSFAETDMYGAVEQALSAARQRLRVVID